ncbi:MAG: hypothetical protein ACREN8_10375 [Candidatus Dormibacteraceae bacterium]
MAEVDTTVTAGGAANAVAAGIVAIEASVRAAAVPPLASNLVNLLWVITLYLLKFEVF